ncbi:MAG: type ISP restriction/modification enzyme [Pseudomonadota bacterium]
MPTALQTLLNTYRHHAQSEREKGSYFEELICTYLRHEPRYADLYFQVWRYADWARDTGRDIRDVGIDLVAATRSGDIHAIQCKCYATDYRLRKNDIDSFFTASGQAPFSHRIIVSTTLHWTEHAENALVGQTPPVTRIDLQDLENSQIDWSRYQSQTPVCLKPRKQLLPHQQTAVEKVLTGLQTADRGKLIMACGTGKTYTSLKIAEAQAGAGKHILFLVPSLSLLSQTLTEWTQESATPLHSFAVCSDQETGKKRTSNDDQVAIYAHELRYPATTQPQRLASAMQTNQDANHMMVVFSTYHSQHVIHQAQQEYGLADFDLIICDEAHRTTGATFAGEDESHFVRIHDADFIRGAKRLYMTATPRIYGDQARASAERDNIALASMDDPDLYGQNLHTLNFSRAVQQDLLVDYKVIVLAMDRQHVSDRLQALLRDEDNSLKLDDAARIVGCWKALSKHQTTESRHTLDPEPMRRAVAFCQVIEPTTGRKTHKVSSRQIAGIFQSVVATYQDDEREHGTLQCEAEHIDGSMHAHQKEAKLNWLKAEPPANTCRILSNVRCLSEGVDVPALDAVLFLTPRNSQVDVVQSVGRVMRKAPGKTCGYVILPVVIPPDTTPHAALTDNTTYRVVWEVLQALRSHDDRFDAMINKMDLTQAPPDKIEVIAVNNQTISPAKPHRTRQQQQAQQARASQTIGQPVRSMPQEKQLHLEFQPGEIERALFAKIVEKCGRRTYWEEWANDIADIANTHITRITSIVRHPANHRERAAFQAFVRELRDDLNPAISEGEVIDMLAQHLITEPVFAALFGDNRFARHNPVSQGMQKILNLLHEHHLEKETDTLQGFYHSVRLRAAGIDNAAGKQKIVVELYDKFFRNAFPKMTERLGIVYTPVQVVDFILHSINHLLQTEFNQTLGSPGVHILDPFTGTGTFITRLLHSGLIAPDQLAHKYQQEIHANEIVLLAYYIAAINIETSYHSLSNADYTPFPGICLTDTFQLHEQDDLIQQLLPENSTRRQRQKSLTDIQVILGNPPYSAGQTNANDNNQNIPYPKLDERIKTTYVKRSAMTSVRQLYDSYIRAIRWASDRLGDSGIIGFVTNAGFLETNQADGLRQCLAEEFASIWIFHLRGNQRTAGERSRQEGGKIFGSGSRAPIAITFLVRNPAATRHGQIYLHDIGDYLTREQKLDKITDLISLAGITQTDGWQTIVPDRHGDWLNQRDDWFDEFVVLGDKKGNQLTLFANYSLGIVTNRDAWCYNASRHTVANSMQDMITCYNEEVSRFNTAHQTETTQARKTLVADFIDNDPTRISWTRALKADLAKGHTYVYQPQCLIRSLYRPFSKQWLYYNRHFNEMVLQMPRIFPVTGEANLVIMTTAKGIKNGFSCTISNTIPDLNSMEAGAQCFPRYLYDEDGSNRHDALTDAGLAHFQAAYPNETLSKDDLFYYIYGLLHSPDYRTRYAHNLSKALPRIPPVRRFTDFQAFTQAGRELAELHLHYDTVAPYPATLDSSATANHHYRVEKMRYGKRKIDGKSHKDRTTIVYNPRITVRDIPEAAYDYVVNGKSAIDWVVERQCVKTDKKSGITNDANRWATETEGNPRYPLELLLRVITISLRSIDIIKHLPALNIPQ